jgi:diadenosine tetraphosphate (Ap4A) HIT family hydrolase
MMAWADAERWARMRSGEDCPICRRGGPNDVVADLAVCWVTAGERAPMRGYCCLVVKRYAVELHDLTDEEAVAYMRDIQQLSRAVQRVTGAVKMNYEVHGNTLPHLHMHVYPRQVGDRFEGGPITAGTIEDSAYGAEQYREFVEQLQWQLAAAGAP